MELTKTLRSEIENGIAELGMNFSSFGERSGINRGIFSAILNGTPPKPISLNQMEAITRAFGKPEGWMFDLYIEECFYDGKPNRRRVEPFLIRCAELGRTDCIREVLSRLLEDLKHVSMIFDIAETLFTTGRKQESLIFYECVVENEKYHHSERLAISHYRIFRAAIGEDNEQNLRAALRFESFCGKLPDHHRLDGLLQLTNVYYSLERWKTAEHYADELIEFSATVYENENAKRKKSKKYEPLMTDRPLVKYYGQGYLVKGGMLEAQEHYEEARAFIDKYADLSWFEGLDSDGQIEVDKFKLFAKANRLNLEILMGNTEYLEEYMQFLEQHPQEILPSFLTIIESANKHSFSIDFVIHHFSAYLKDEEDIPKIKDSYYRQTTINRILPNLFHELSIYYAKKENYVRAIDYSLQSLKKSIKISNKNVFMKCVPFFEEFRTFATLEQTKRYEILMKEMYQNA
ncbi:DNA-binding protein [Saccharibacillus brassicae]|uniref:DNA-binding protein n=1 Tax=Saccharibacillus brassicae TaxID=2583377 RepID=A0A4Y6UY33_SACBS|nr:DNA-binding protein [Saccharibacillus brassicae]QDH20935.1 DNA-binding protein [Saccharibacillus brassicae]